MADIDPMMVENEAIFPSDETKARVQVFMELSDAQQASFSEKFAALAGA